MLICHAFNCCAATWFARQFAPRLGRAMRQQDNVRMFSRASEHSDNRRLACAVLGKTGLWRRQVVRQQLSKP